MESIKILGHEIRAGVCNCYTVRVRSKLFDEWLHEVGKENNNINLTELKLMELVNTAQTLEINKSSEELYLTIETQDYQIVVVLEEVA